MTRMHELHALLPPPRHPHDPPSDEDWDSVQSAYGQLPADLKTFVRSYGTGCIDGFIWIFNPASDNPYLNLRIQIEKQLSALAAFPPHELRSMIKLNQLLPIGITDNGDVLALTRDEHGRADKVMVIDSRSPRYQQFESGVDEFLIQVLAGTNRCSIFPQDFPSSCPVFEPA